MKSLAPLLLALLLALSFQRTESILDSGDRAILTAFYNGLTEKGLLFWSDFECHEDGIICDYFVEPQRVVGLEIPSRGIRGSVPSDLGGLTKLASLDLSNNALSGKIPDNLQFLSALQVLKLNDNGLTGTIPSTWNSLSNLEVLALENNALTGGLPNWSSLTALMTLTVLGSNQLCPYDDYSAWSATVTDYVDGSGCVNCFCNGGSCNPVGLGYQCLACPLDQFGYFCELTIDPDPQVDFAVTETFLNTQSDAFEIELMTNAPWPLFLSSPSFHRIIPEVPYELYTEHDPFFVPTEYELCRLSRRDSECLQKFKFVVSGTYPPYCNLGGVYEVSWVLSCRPSHFPSCPYSDNTLAVNLTIASNQVCTPASIMANLTSSLSSFDDPDFLVPQTVFVANETAYFKLDYETESTPVSFSVRTVVVSRGRFSTFFLVSGGIVSAAYPDVEFAFSPGDQREFSFKLLTSDSPQALFSPLELGTTLPFSIEVEFEFGYGYTERKRDRTSLSERHTIFLSKDL